MSDLDTLIVTFQTQLSDVMEAVLKTAMFEVTRLVEDVLLVEVRRGKQEVESLRLQLHTTEGKFSGDGGKTRFVGCARIDSDQSTDTIEGRPPNLQDDMSKRYDVENPSDSVECWISNHKESKVASPDHPPTTPSPERGSQTTEEVVLIPNVDMKEEEIQKLSCSLHLRRWSSTLDGEVPFKSDNISELVETQPTTTQRESEEILKTHIKKDPQASTSCEFPEDQTEMHMATDQPNVSAYEDSSWAGLPAAAAGLLQNHKLNSENDSDSVKTKGSVKQVEHMLPDSVRADVQFNSNQDQLSSSESPQIRLQPSNTLGVTIKEEVVIDSYGCKESEQAEEKTKKAGTSSFSCLVQQRRVNSEAQIHIYPKASVQEVTKLHSNKGAGLRLQAAMQHLHRPLKKTPHTFPNSPSAALSTANCQLVNVNRLNRISTTSKTVAAPLSVQRVHLGAKHTAGQNRTGASWVSIKSQHQSANCDNPNPAPHPNSQLYTGSRQLLRCGQCGKCFPHPSNLKSHLQTHTGERPFCCSLCGRSFTKLSNLKAHRRVHTGERPYCCLACGKRFTQKCNLKRHQRIHLDI